MQLFHRFTHPTDRRWQGPQKDAPIILLNIAILVSLILIAFLSSIFVSIHLSNVYNDARARKDYTLDPPPIIWDDDGVSKFFIEFFGLLFELFHLPISIILFLRGHLHPIAALTLACCGVGIWISQALFSMFVVVGAETELTGGYWGVFIWMLAMEFSVLALYLVYVGFTARGVHEWRAEGRRKSFTRMEDLKGEELRDLGKV